MGVWKGKLQKEGTKYYSSKDRASESLTRPGTAQGTRDSTLILYWYLWWKSAMDQDKPWKNLNHLQRCFLYIRDDQHQNWPWFHITIWHHCLMRYTPSQVYSFLLASGFLIRPCFTSLFWDPSHEILLQTKMVSFLYLGDIKEVHIEYRGRRFYSCCLLILKKKGLFVLSQIWRNWKKSQIQDGYTASIISSIQIQDWFVALALQNTCFHIVI